MSQADTEEVGEQPLYTESPIIMATVRMIAPFVFTFGLFIMFHGADSAGGGFQGGVIVATVVIMLGIAFGIDPTRDWVNPYLLVGLAGFGMSVFLFVGLVTIGFDGGFLEYSAIEMDHAVKYGVEVVELAIGVTVASVLSGLFFSIDSGVLGDGDD